MSRPHEGQRRFVAALEELVRQENRAALAALRRGLGKAPGEVAETHRFVVPWLPGGLNRWQEDAYYLVASLFAWHQRAWHPSDDSRALTNFGASFARLMDADGSDSTEKRFVALMNAHEDALPEHLRGTVGLMKAKEIPIDWAQLLRDIQGWGWESRSVQRDWARAFWGRSGNTSSEAETAVATPSDEDEE